MYSYSMNIKRKRKQIFHRLSTFDLNKRDLINIEKIILKRVKPRDFYIKIGKRSKLIEDTRETSSSARYIHERSNTINYLDIRSVSPNIIIKFKPHSTEIIMQKIYSKGEKLREIEDTRLELKKYLATKKNPSNNFFKKLIHKNSIDLNQK
jgi:hypothetical protein